MKFRFDSIEEEKKKEIRALAENRSLIGAIENALSEGRTPIIAEVKRGSPSRGKIREIEPDKAAPLMEKGGACAISVLTDKHFNGKVCFLRKVKDVVGIPVLRKDFIVDGFQLYESKGNGANAVLLIAALLKDKTTLYVDKARELDLEALVEVHDETDLGYALDSGARLIGINNRDLSTLKTELGVTERLAPLIPKNRIIVSESGIETTEDIKRLQKAGATAFLVGTSIMQSKNIEKKVRELATRT
jgi:indole-3-glycerol phosphate synthase